MGQPGSPDSRMNASAAAACFLGLGPPPRHVTAFPAALHWGSASGAQAVGREEAESCLPAS